ncbi:MAG: hypothetical protein ABIQ74_00515 [Chitinophagales bacterium]
MNRKIKFILIASLSVVILLIGGYFALTLKEINERQELFQMVQNTFENRVPTTLSDSINTLFNNVSFALAKERFELFDVKETIEDQTTVQKENTFYNPLLDFKFKLNQIIQSKCPDFENTTLDSLSYLNKTSWSFSNSQAIDSVLSELRRLDNYLPELEKRIFEACDKNE